MIKTRGGIKINMKIKFSKWYVMYIIYTIADRARNSSFEPIREAIRTGFEEVRSNEISFHNHTRFIHLILYFKQN